MLYRSILFIALFFGITFSLFSQQGISLSITPGVDLPTGGGDKDLGTYTINGETELYTLGGGVSLAGNWGLSSEPLFLSAAIDTSFINTINDKNMTFFGFTAGGGYSYSSYMYEARLYAGLGGAVGTYFTDNVMNFYAKAGATVFINLSTTFSVGPTMEYRYFHNNYNGIYVGVTGKIAPVPPLSEDQARYIGIQLSPVYPALYMNAQEYPSGLLTFVNGEEGDIEDIEVLFYARDHMKKPFSCAEFVRLESGKTISVPIITALEKTALANTEEIFLSGEVTIKYTYRGKRKTLRTTKQFTLADSHSFVSNDLERAVVFVTPEEISLTQYSTQVADQIASVAMTPVDRNFRMAMALFTALSAQGMSLTDRDDQASGLEMRLNYPVETMDQNEGNQWDLATAYNALLESTQVETAFISLPDGVVPAFALSLPPQEASSIFNGGDYLQEDGLLWIPVDMALLGEEGFIAAWKSGLERWNGAPSNRREFISVHKGWENYKPVENYPYLDRQKSAGEAPFIIAEYRDELIAYIEDKIAPQERALQDRINRTGDIRSQNKLGVLYARFGLLNKAQKQFEPLSYSYAPAAINMGNIFFLQEDYVKAYINYIAAAELDRENKYALLGKARTARILGEQEMAELTYRKLSALDINLAIPFGYIVESEANQNNSEPQKPIYWVEE